MSKYVYGIDFGTANTSLAILNVDKREILKVFSDASFLYLSPDNQIYTGQEARLKFLSDDRKGLFFRSLKYLLTTGTSEITVFDKSYSIRYIITMLLSALKKKADEAIRQNVTEAVLGRPFRYCKEHTADLTAEDHLIYAAFDTGFKVVHIQNEAIAAGYYLENWRQAKGISVIADLGAGKSDFAVMDLDPGKSHKSNRKKDILFQTGMMEGGELVDYTILQYKSDVFRISPTGGSPSGPKRLFFQTTSDLEKLLQEAESAKIRFSRDQSDPYLKIENDYFFIDRKEFENCLHEYQHLLDEHLIKIKEYTRQKKGFTLYLRGGSSGLANVRTMFSTLDPSRIHLSGPAEEEVVKGLALSYFYY